ncbi:MAG: hypothetical protein WCT40_04245 [Candidatus Magasanikbacteria bacterium]
MKFPPHAKKLLWDVDTKKIGPRHQKFVITRLADKGNWSDFLWLKKTFGVKTVKQVVIHSRNVSAKTKNFWKVLCDKYYFE